MDLLVIHENILQNKRAIDVLDTLIAGNAKSSLPDKQAKENIYSAQHLEQGFK